MAGLEATRDTGEQSWTTEVTLSAPGVYDPEKQLSDEEIIALKEKFKDDPFYRGFKKVATHIVMKMCKEDYEHDVEEAKSEGLEVPPFIGENGQYASLDQYVLWVGSLSIDWAMSLRTAVELPGAEWPEYITPPATFAEALKEIEAGQAAHMEIIDG